MTYLPELTTFTAFQTTANLGDGATFTSGILDCRGYTQLRTVVNANRDGTIRAEYYSDAGGTDLIRSLSVPYVAASGYQLYAAPVFSDYVRYYFDNSAGAAQTDFFYETQFTKTALNPQIARLDAPIVGGMMAGVSRSILMGTQDGGAYINVPVDDHGHLEVAVHSPLTMFRDLRVAEPTPAFGERFSYGVDTDLWETRTNNGTVGEANGALEVTSGAGNGDFGEIMSRRRVIYQPGMGNILRFTAAFPDGGTTNHEQIVGIGTVESGWFIGHRKADGAFGFLARYGGKREIRTLTVSAGASGAETAAITLNGVLENVSITSGTATFNAGEIAAHDFSGVGDGWDVDQVGATVIFISRTAEPLSGSYTATSGGTFAGTFAQTRAGATATDEWTLQTAWNGDVFDGAGGESNPSGVALDITVGNVYTIGYQYLGYGPQFLLIEQNPGGNSVTYYNAHTRAYLNANAYPSVENPCAPVLVSSRSHGATVDKTIRSASFGAFIEGKEPKERSSPTVDQITASLGTTEIPLFTVRLPYTFKDRASQVEAVLQKLLVAFKPQNANYYGTFRIRRNTTLTGGTNFTRPNTNDAMLVDNTATGVSGGDIVWAKTFVDTGDAEVHLTDEVRDFEPGTQYTLTVVANNGTTNLASGTLIFAEKH